MKSKTVYKVNVTFQGTASLEIEAETVDEARRLASELTVIDLARQGHTDILSLKIGARELTPVRALSGQHDEEDEPGAQKPRPSGWYRPPI